MFASDDDDDDATGTPPPRRDRYQLQIHAEIHYTFVRNCVCPSHTFLGHSIERQQVLAHTHTRAQSTRNNRLCASHAPRVVVVVVVVAKAFCTRDRTEPSAERAIFLCERLVATPTRAPKRTADGRTGELTDGISSSVRGARSKCIFVYSHRRSPSDDDR